MQSRKIRQRCRLQRRVHAAAGRQPRSIWSGRHRRASLTPPPCQAHRDGRLLLARLGAAGPAALACRRGVRRLCLLLLLLLLLHLLACSGCRAAGAARRARRPRRPPAARRLLRLQQLADGVWDWHLLSSGGGLVGRRLHHLLPLILRSDVSRHLPSRLPPRAGATCGRAAAACLGPCGRPGRPRILASCRGGRGLEAGRRRPHLL